MAVQEEEVVVVVDGAEEGGEGEEAGTGPPMVVEVAVDHMVVSLL